MDKGLIRSMFKTIALEIDRSNCADKSYMLTVLKKLYWLLGLRTAEDGKAVPYDPQQEFDEWLVLMSWCEMMSMITFQDLKVKKDNWKILMNYTKLLNDIRQGLYLDYEIPEDEYSGNIQKNE